MPQPQLWPDCDEAIYQYITGFVELLRGKLGSRLTGVYLHGSLAMGSYFPPKSDMDFIIVTERSLDVETANDLNLSIARYAEKCPTVGNIECSVITLETARNVPDEIPYELHYSESWHKKILNDQVTYGIRQIDPDLPAHLMCVKRRGICLYGMEIDKVFGEVEWHNFILAVLDDFDWIVEGDNICESPYYGILNICRNLQLFRENNEKYLSKYEGAIWGIKHLPSEYMPLIEQALAIYSSNAIAAELERKTGGLVWDKTALLVFRDYAREERWKYDK